MNFTRRDALVFGAGALASSVVTSGHAQENELPAARHGMSAFGDLKYPADFSHFDYVNPGAPKGGVFSQIGPNRQYNQSFQTFNTLNSYILKGEGAQGMGLTFATLMAGAGDEPDSMYGLAARSVRISPDGLTYQFALRSEARFHDGTPLTAQDVVFSLETLKTKGHPIITQLLRDFSGAEATDAATVMAHFAPKRGRDVPLYVAGLPIFSRAYYTTKNFEESTLDVPLGSGPYKVGRFEVNRFIEFERVKDWWGADLPVARGLNNFDIVRFEYYRDRDVAFEGFTGGSYLFREEFTSRIWATRYDFPAVTDHRVKKDVLPDRTPSGAQGWFINTRRERFKNPKMREALNYAFDFEWTNRNIMYGSYDRTVSIFQNSDMMAEGKPAADELALLEPFRGRVPDEVFGEPFVPPVSDASGQDRKLLREAARLLREAGYQVENGKLRDAQGTPVTIEFLLDEQSFEPHHQLFVKNLTLLGISASIRLVDPVQYRARVDGFDFDLTVERFSFSATPGDALRSYFSSQAAGLKGSNNLAGVAEPAIDAMIDHIIAAESRPALRAACKALDRLFRAGRYWVPHWYKPTHWVAYWDVFGHPSEQPRYTLGIPDTWWRNPHQASTSERK